MSQRAYVPCINIGYSLVKETRNKYTICIKYTMYLYILYVQRWGCYEKGTQDSSKEYKE